MEPIIGIGLLYLGLVIGDPSSSVSSSESQCRHNQTSSVNAIKADVMPTIPWYVCNLGAI